MEATTMYAFTKTSEDEMSFEKGKIIKILNDADDAQWAKAEMDGEVGMVPKNYIQIKPCEWYKGRISRARAEELLLTQWELDGAFLIRDSESTPGDFSVSVRFGNGVQHFKVLRDGGGKYFLWVVKFNSLNQLVDYHRTSSVSRTQTIYLKDMKEKKNQTALALYDFISQDETELNFKKGDTLELLDDPAEDWVRGRLGGQEGLVPVPYVKVLAD